MKKNYFLLLFLFIGFLSCDNYYVDNFYKKSTEVDRLRLPLIKPYQLYSNNTGKEFWQLDFINKNHEIYLMHLNVCKINIINRTIYGHCMDYQCYPNLYFTITLDDSVENIFDNRNDWIDFLNERNIESENLFDVWEVYKIFKSDYSKLPWYKQIAK